MKLHDIESTKNPIFKEFESLLTGTGILETASAFIFGDKAIEETLKNHPEKVKGLIIDKNIQSSFGTQIDQVYRLANPLFKELDIFGTKSAILIVEIPKFQKLEKKLSGCSLLLLLQDPSNVGALLRSAAAFGVDQIILGPGCAHPFHPKSSRASSGTLFMHQYFQIKTFAELEQLPVPIVALDRKGQSLYNYKFPESFILMPGQEGPGLSIEQKKFTKDLVSIPLSGGVESLNAMVATTIALYAWKNPK
jgi:TrmH family RNA methyltransferase